MQLILQGYLIAKTVQHKSYEAMRALSIFDLLTSPLYKRPWCARGSRRAKSEVNREEQSCLMAPHEVRRGMAYTEESSFLMMSPHEVREGGALDRA